VELGIVGMTMVGKTTLFNALTGLSTATRAYASSAKDTHRAAVKVPDERLDRLAALFAPKKVTPATVEYVDLAGLTAGSTEKKGLSPQFLGALRNVDALVHVVRAFDNPNVPHVHETLDPLRDARELDYEFALADLIIVETRLERLAKETRTTKNPALLHEQAILQRCQAILTDGTPLRELAFDDEEARLIRGFRFLTDKPMLVVVNVGEGEEGDAALAPFADWNGKPKVGVTSVCATMEMELARLPAEDAKAFRADLGLMESALSKMIRLSYTLLGLKTFLTAGDDEVRAWTVPARATALEAAAAIHSDLARGFIRCETIFWEELIAQGSYAKARSAGLLRLEGKEYIVRDGDVIVIRFSV
jgi:hypothetical protein